MTTSTPSPFQSGREQRSAPRVDTRIEIDLEVDGSEHNSYTKDLSATGAAVEYPAAIELGQVFQLAFTLPDDGERVECVGLVRSFRPGPGGSRVVGLEFHNLPPEKRRAVARYVAWVMSGEDVQQATSHWSASDPGNATVAEADDRAVIRWAPGFADVFLEVAAHVQQITQLFVPVRNSEVGVGDRVWFELVPPNSHVVIRAMAEVTWVEDGDSESGVGLRIAGLSPMDRHVLASVRSWFAREKARYS
ncbi:MAG: hypothetical protein GY898_20940 [Proteobacteria bacterium]|nr:hypothetical protein [Pseudomonadota bacterium]